MATLTGNREIKYGNLVEFVEHKTGKTVLSWRREMHRIGFTVFFTDKTCVYCDEYGEWPDNPKYEPTPGSICASCGQDHHATFWNWKGQCNSTVKKFWLQARKIYWYRYQKNPTRYAAK